MELKELKLIRVAKAYLVKARKKSAEKDYKEKINAIVKGLIQDKKPKETIQMIKDINDLVNTKLDEKLDESIKFVEDISNFKKLKA